MSHHGFQRRRPLRSLVTPLIALSILAWTPASLADSVTASVPQQPDNETPAERRQTQVEALRLQVQGMEDKLKESANARKAADQARMEAERHLAEGAQEVEQLRAEIKELQAAQRALEARLDARKAEVARLNANLSTAMKGYDETAERLADLQRQLPASDGGSLTPEEARQSAAEALAVLRGARQRPGGIQDPATFRAIANAEAILHRRQFRLASVIDAQGVYRVRASDSLGLISSRFYGGSGQWRKIYEANRHVLENPDRLAPGTTLVIP